MYSSLNIVLNSDKILRNTGYNSGIVGLRISAFPWTPYIDWNGLPLCQQVVINSGKLRPKDSVWPIKKN